MKFAIAIAFLCLGGSALAYDDGSYKGEGLAESQDYGQYNQQYYNQPYAYAPVYSQVHAEDDGSWKGEGLAESQDYGQYNNYASGAVHYGGGAPLGADGRVVDTPEVAQAKAAHFAALAAASHGPAAPAYAGSYGSYGAAHIELTPDGKYIKDTPEVAQAKAAHFAAVNAASQSHHGPAQPAPIYGQYGVAPIELTPDGKFIKDTPEVAHARAQHLAALAAASNRHY